MWEQNKVITIPLIIGATGEKPRYLNKNRRIGCSSRPLYRNAKHRTPGNVQYLEKYLMTQTPKLDTKVTTIY